MQLCLSQVSKNYEGKKWGVQDICLDIESKRIGILGPYGSGKTTLAHIISTITKPSKGTITFNGTDLSESTEEYRSLLGYIPQYFGMYSTLTTFEYLEYIAALKGNNRALAHNRVDQVLERMSLTEAKSAMTGSLPPLMRQRFGIAQMLLADPRVLVVDELSEELNPEERREILHLLAEESAGKILILTSEHASDYEGWIDELYIMMNGKIVMQTTPAQLVSSFESNVWEMVIPNANLLTVLRKYLILKTEHTREGVHIRCISATEPHEQAVKVAPTLDDAYAYFLSQVKGTVQ